MVAGGLDPAVLAHADVADDDVSLVAYVDGAVAAMTMLRVDRAQRAGAERAHRRPGRRTAGRGLARLLKSHSLHLRGAGRCDAGDHQQRRDPTRRCCAVNTALGYRPYSRRVEWERQRGDA